MVAISFRKTGLPEKLQAAAEAYDLTSKTDFDALVELSERTVFESIDVHGDSAVRDGDKYFAPATIYVTLNYGENNEVDEVSWEDAYPARVHFSLKNGEPSVDRIDVDTSSFFGQDEGEGD